jgi:hypothetical protein
MEGAQFLLEAVLVLLLGATLFHALRLERALGVLKRDRAVLEGLVAGFNESTRAAEAGIDRLRGATDGAGRQIARQIEIAQRLRDDLGFLTERGESLAERLEGGIRSARMLADQQAMTPPPMPARGQGMHHGMSQAGMSQTGMSQTGMSQTGISQAGAFPGNPAQQGGPGAIMPHHMPPPPNTSHPMAPPHPPMEVAPVYAAPEPAAQPRLRSEAERDLLRALRAAR